MTTPAVVAPDLVAPCPFCSKSVHSICTLAEMMHDDDNYFDDGQAPSYAVHCDASRPNGPGGCGASGGYALTEAEAIEKWNRRAAALAQGDAEPDECYKRMFMAAVAGLAEISVALGISDDEAECANGNGLILDRIAALAAPPESPVPTQPIAKYVALAEKCGAEVGRYEGEMVWMKFHSQSSVEAFVTGIVMLAALRTAPTQAATGGEQLYRRIAVYAGLGQQTAAYEPVAAPAEAAEPSAEYFIAAQDREIASQTAAAVPAPVDERAAFEAWAGDQGFLLQYTVRGDEYQDLRTQGPWDAWQARAALPQPPRAAEPVGRFTASSKYGNKMEWFAAFPEGVTEVYAAPPAAQPDRETVLGVAEDAGVLLPGGPNWAPSVVSLERFAGEWHECGYKQGRADEATQNRLTAQSDAKDAALLEALTTAEAALADIGDADREPGDDLAWCESRAAEALPTVRAAIAAAQEAQP